MKLDASVYKELQSIFGQECVLSSEVDKVAYGYDGSRRQSSPDAIVRARTVAQISQLLTVANDKRIPVIPRGAGSNTTGGVLAVRGGIVLDMSLMNRILSIDPQNLYAEVEPGVVVGDLQKAVEAMGLFYPPDPASSDFCTIGGNVAEGAGGLRGLKYGVTRDYVLGLEVVLPGGAIIRTGSATIKSVVGYDLTRLMVGSEGTLGVITRIRLKLIPLPLSSGTALISFGNDLEALEAASEIVAARMLPRALEFVDHRALSVVRKAGESVTTEEGQAILLVEFDGAVSSVGEDLGRLEQLMAGKCVSFSKALDAVERARLWKMRKSISPSIYKLAPVKASEDICVPRSALGKILLVLEGLEQKYGIPVLSYGHAGDGNLHVNFLLSDDSPELSEKSEAAIKELFEQTIGLSGTLSGEHGIGVTKQPYIQLEILPVEMALMWKIKQCFDPDGILNPGKVFPVDFESRKPKAH
ncbi:MAG: FAD-linked oxidase C-terminal domain-containing protein [Candidatus Brocadiia bacterium]